MLNLFVKAEMLSDVWNLIVHLKLLRTNNSKSFKNLGTNSLQKNKQALENTLLKTWEYLPPFFITSATKYVGREELLDRIQQDLTSSHP